MDHFKDEILNRLSERANIAQFVSFGPDLAQRFSRIRGHRPNFRFQSPEQAIKALITASSDQLVNIRSFLPQQPEGGEFIGKKHDDEVWQHVQRLGSRGYYMIVNETIDVNDGGVSGVLLGSVIEFAPGETPRCVEGTEFVSLPRKQGLLLLERVYGFKPALEYAPDVRVEFSLHPRRRGFTRDHTIIWETQKSKPLRTRPGIRWPNAFSRMLGDKAFGLLLSEVFGFRVPKALVVGRRIPPFVVGEPTGEINKWIRTCPHEPKPGFFTTIRGYSDPFALMAREDPAGRELASLLVQDEVVPEFSGAVLTSRDGEAIIEGIAGAGDRLMLGEVAPTDLPTGIRRQVADIHEKAKERFGPVRIEWVWGSGTVWIVQMQQEAAVSSGYTIVPGHPARYHSFKTSDGVAKLREITEQLQGKNEGVLVIGKIGMTSHVADILRRMRIPSKVVFSDEALVDTVPH
jgi:hypothetical protein